MKLRKIILFLLVFLLIASISGCTGMRERRAGGAASPTALHDGTVQVGNQNRTFSVFVPTNIPAQRIVPLVLAFHGAMGSGRRFAAQSNLEQHAQRHGFILVFPDAGNRQWNDGRFPEDRTDDVGFIRILIRELAERHPIDLRRVYMTGVSNGGLFSFRLACEAGDLIAAAAPVIASMPVNLVPQCRPDGPMPLLMINSDQDPFVPFEGGELARLPLTSYGGGTVISVPKTVDFWRRINRCSDRTREELLPDRDPRDGTRVRRIDYLDCAHSADITLYIVQGGGHAWPGSAIQPTLRRSGLSSRDIDASEIIWEFFSRHHLP
jgi:polyhydroxybutyrate depolymerase